MQENVRKEFLPLESKPWWIITWLARIFGGALLAGVFLLLLLLPFLLIDFKVVFIIAAILYYPAWGYAVYGLVRHMRRSRRESVVHILVDDKGIHYTKFDGSKEEILYSRLEKWSLSDVYDVKVSPQRKTWALEIKYDDSHQKVDFDRIDPGFTYYTGNTRVLRRRFVQGIACFRPDISIDPFVFEAFYIHPETFTFDKKNYGKTMLQTLGTLIVGGVILGLIMWGIVKWLF